MDKNLLINLSKIIRDIESKNLHKEADTLNNCLIRLAQMTTDDSTQTTPEAMQPQVENEVSYTPEFITKFGDFVNKSTSFAQKAKDIATIGKIDNVQMSELDDLITKSNELIDMNQAKDQDAMDLESMHETLVNFKNNFTQSA